MKRQLLISMVALFLIVESHSVVATPPATYISNCDSTYYITKPGRYALETDIHRLTSGACIVIQASRVKLSLNGHTIYGNNLASAGIWVYGGSRVTINGPGRVTGFTHSYLPNRGGVVIGNNDYVTSQVSVSGLLLDSNHTGLSTARLSDTNNVTISNNVISGSKFHGIYIQPGTYNNVIERNDIINNVETGIFTNGYSTSVLKNNVSYNYKNITLHAGADDSLIDSNIAIGGDVDIWADPGIVSGSIINENTCLISDGGSYCVAFSSLDINH